MKICIITVGKRHDATIASAIVDYQQRLERMYVLDWVYIAPSSLQLEEARKVESAKILANIKDSDMVWLLDERGEQLTSPTVSAKIETYKVHAINRLVFVIGGAYGVDDTVRKRAQFVWALSTLVFPHQLVRLMLVEQLYRAAEIAKGSGYHHA